jgi:hypothetical protein
VATLNGYAKYTDEMVRSFRRKAASGWSVEKLCSVYGERPQLMKELLAGKRYGWVGEWSEDEWAGIREGHWPKYYDVEAGCWRMPNE